MNARIAFSLVALLLAGCGGGGGSHSPTPALPAAAQNVQMQSGTIGLSFGTNSATAAKSRTPLFVSPGATQATISVNGGTASTFDVSSSSALCATNTTTSVRSCVIPLSAPVGQNSMLVVLAEPFNGVAVTLGQGTNSFTVALGTPFNLTVGINPVVAGISSGNLKMPSGTAFTYGVQSSATGTVVFADQSLTDITGSGNVPNFFAPVSITSNDAHFTVSPATLTTPGQGFTITYDGSPLVIQQPTISLTVPFGTTTARALGSGQFTLSGLLATRYNLGTAGAFQPNQITVGPDGNIWWVERSTSDVGTLNLTTKAIVHYPAGTGSTTGIAVGGDHFIYYSNSTRVIGWMDANGVPQGSVTVGVPGTQVGRMAADSSGNVWFVGAGSPTAQVLGYIDMTSHTAVTFGGPTTTGGLSTSSDLTLGPDNAMYILEAGGTGTHALQRITTVANGSAGSKSETAIPGTSISVTPLGIASDGTNLWISVFANTATSQFYAEATPGVTSVITEFASSINPAAFANLINMTKGSDGNMWIVEGGGAARFNPSAPSTSVVQFFTDNGGSSMNDCVTGPDKNLYCTVTGSSANPPFAATQDSILSFPPR